MYLSVSTPIDYQMLDKLHKIQQQSNEVDLFKILLEDMPIVPLEVLEEANNLFLETLPASKHNLI